ncbi:MAG: hypothetical protein HOP23_05220 [Methylococcaceae bacterium]|nr:hypothetical protein [Methylococcaceae bacterium]
MSKFVFAWELGAGYGHIDGFLPIAKILQRRGHEVTWVLKDLLYAPLLFTTYSFSYFQAPICWPISHTAPAMNYAGILQNIGFNDKFGLLARTQAWKTLFEYLNPDLILLDHAPTALLAARSLHYPRALFGGSFFSPPRTRPMPSIRPWLNIAEKTLLNTENEVVTIANSVLTQIGGPTLDTLADLFDIEENFLCTYSELDHYSNRDNAIYWGSNFNDADGVEPVWPPGDKKRIFVYLKNDYAGLETLLNQLRSSSYSVLAHIPGINPAFIQKFSNVNLHISPYPVKLSGIGETCDAVICHAGAGTAAAMLLKGKPLMMLPMQVEQLLLAKKIALLGAGLCIPAEVKKANFPATIKELLTQEYYKNNAEQFSKKYKNTHLQKQQESIATRCEELLRTSQLSATSVSM